MSMVCEIAGNLSSIRDRIAAVAEETGRNSPGITLVAISKSHSQERIRAALEANHRVFGENRVQEAYAKWQGLKERYSDVDLHLVGSLQTNKAGDAVALFDVIHTLDRARLARALAQEFEKQGKAPSLYVQVNTGEEPQKAGVLPCEADEFIRTCRTQYGLTISGLMCIPPASESPVPHFVLLAGIAERNGIDSLSMGMSADFETAIRFGATHIRVGTAIFGARPQKPSP